MLDTRPRRTNRPTAARPAPQDVGKGRAVPGRCPRMSSHGRRVSPGNQQSRTQWRRRSGCSPCDRSTSGGRARSKRQTAAGPRAAYRPRGEGSCRAQEALDLALGEALREGRPDVGIAAGIAAVDLDHGQHQPFREPRIDRGPKDAADDRGFSQSGPRAALRIRSARTRVEPPDYCAQPEGPHQNGLDDPREEKRQHGPFHEKKRKARNQPPCGPRG